MSAAPPSSTHELRYVLDRSESIGNLAGGLALAQSAIRAASKDRNNPFFKSDYATLASVWAACRDHLGKNGLSVVQMPQLEGERLFLDTWLVHKSGEWMKSRYPVNPSKNDPQGIGSAVTYARRYSLAAMVGVYSADEDDDGEAAMGRNAGEVAARRARGDGDRGSKQAPPKNVSELKARNAASGESQPSGDRPVVRPGDPPPDPLAEAKRDAYGADGICADCEASPTMFCEVHSAPPGPDAEEWRKIADMLVSELGTAPDEQALKKHKKKYAQTYADLKDKAHAEYSRVIDAGKSAAERIANT